MIKILRIIFILLSVLLICLSLSGCNFYGNKEKVFKVGITVYDIKDPYMVTFMEKLENNLKKAFAYENVVLRYEILDSDCDKNIQIKQMNYLMKQNCDVLLLNLVNASSTAEVLYMAISKDIPIVLYNREPNVSDMNMGDKIWYVGTDGYLEGQLQGDMVKELWDRHSDVLDKNNNGKLDYIMLEGEPDYFVSHRRTEGLLQRLENYGMPMNLLANFTANWDRKKAYRTMDNLPQEIISEAELIIGNNDDMVLGAYDFYAAKSLACPKMIGINNNLTMQKLIRKGEAYGSIDINQEGQTEMIANLVNKIYNKQTIQGKVFYAKPSINKNSY